MEVIGNKVEIWESLAVSLVAKVINLLDAVHLVMAPVTGKELSRSRHSFFQRTLSISKSSALATSRLVPLDPYKTISSSKFWYAILQIRVLIVNTWQ